MLPRNSKWSAWSTRLGARYPLLFGWRSNQATMRSAITPAGSQRPASRGGYRCPNSVVFAFSMGSESCRGFSLWDDYAPILAVNTAWLPSARIFTTGRDSSQSVASSGLRPRTPTLTVNWSQAERGDRGIIELRPHRTSAGWTGAARL